MRGRSSHDSREQKGGEPQGSYSRKHWSCLCPSHPELRAFIAFLEWLLLSLLCEPTRPVEFVPSAACRPMQADTAFIKQRSEQLYRSERVALARRKDRMFAVLLVLEWLAGMAVASWSSPHTPIAHFPIVSVEIVAAAVLGAAVRRGAAGSSSSGARSGRT